MSRAARILETTFVLHAITVSCVAAQKAIVVPDAAKCKECRIVLEKVATLDGSRSEYVDEPHSMARMANGRWLLATMKAPTRFIAFDSTGNIAGAAGRRGGGVTALPRPFWWVAIEVADSRWKEAMSPVTGMYGRKTTGVTDPVKYMDTIIEVIDPRDNRLVTSRKFDEQLRFVGESGFAYGYRLDADGVPYIDLHRLNVQRRPGN